MAAVAVYVDKKVPQTYVADVKIVREGEDIQEVSTDYSIHWLAPAQGFECWLANGTRARLRTEPGDECLLTWREL